MQRITIFLITCVMLSFTTDSSLASNEYQSTNEATVLVEQIRTEIPFQMMIEDELHSLSVPVQLEVEFHLDSTQATISDSEVVSIVYAKHSPPSGQRLFNRMVTDTEKQYIAEFLIGANLSESNTLAYLESSYAEEAFAGPYLTNLPSILEKVESDNFYIISRYYPSESYIKNIEVINGETIAVDSCEYWNSDYYSLDTGEFLGADEIRLNAQTINIELIQGELLVTAISYYEDVSFCIDRPEKITVDTSPISPVIAKKNQSATNMASPKPLPTNTPQPTTTSTVIPTPTSTAIPTPLSTATPVVCEYREDIVQEYNNYDWYKSKLYYGSDYCVQHSWSYNYGLAKGELLRLADYVRNRSNNCNEEVRSLLKLLDGVEYFESRCNLWYDEFQDSTQNLWEGVGSIWD